ncbi:MAG: sugar phosphate nucleotidyltransferase [Patescibacteria group bacterium]
MKAIILAGGKATRLWPLTEKFAKPLLIVNGKPLISHIIDNIPTDIDCLVSTIREFNKDFSLWAKKYHPDRKIEIFLEKIPKNLNKIGALKAIDIVIKNKKIKEDILVVAADNYFSFKISDFLKKFKGKTAVGAYDIKSLTEARKFGVLLVDRKNRIISFKEKPLHPESSLVSTACYLIPAKFHQPLSEIAAEFPDNIGIFIEEFLKRGLPVYAFRFSNQWYDIGSYESYLALHQKEKKQIILNKTKNCQLFGSIYIGQKSMIANTVIVDSVVMDKCQIENCTLRNTVIADGAKLKNIDLENKIIPQNTILIG